MPFCNLCASKDGTFERENYYVTPPDGLTAETLRVFGLHGFTSWGIYQLTLVSLTQKTPVAKGRGYRLMAIKQRMIARIRNRSGTRKKTKTAKTTI